MNDKMLNEEALLLSTTDLLWFCADVLSRIGTKLQAV